VWPRADVPRLGCGASQVYTPSRTVVVYAPAEFCDKDADSKPAGIPGLGVKGRGPYFSV
jgi:1,4-alpha-glucan branching enzyme